MIDTPGSGERACSTLNGRVRFCLMVFGKSGLGASTLCTLFTVSSFPAAPERYIELIGSAATPCAIAWIGANPQGFVAAKPQRAATDEPSRTASIHRVPRNRASNAACGRDWPAHVRCSSHL